MSNVLFGDNNTFVRDGEPYSNIAKTGGLIGAGENLHNVDASTGLVFNPAVIVVVKTPTMFDHKPDMGRFFKTVMETHAKSVTGLDFQHQVQTTEIKGGHDKQPVLVPTGTTRTPVNPQFVFDEILGNLIWNSFDEWIQGIQEVDSTVSFAERIRNGETIPPYVMSSFTMSMTVIQFDPTMEPERIIMAPFYTCMFPTEGSMAGIERGEEGKVPERTIPFAAVVRSNKKTTELGYNLAKMLQLNKPDWGNVPVGHDSVDQLIKDSGNESLVKEILGEV